MDNSKSKFFAQFIAGIFGGTILGIPASIIMTIFGTKGYESGLFGAITGMLAGAILAIVIISLAKITNYLKVAIYLLIGAFILPFLCGAIMWPPFEDDDLLIVSPFILIFIVSSAIPSLLITGAINWRKILRRKQSQ